MESRFCRTEGVLVKLHRGFVDLETPKNRNRAGIARETERERERPKANRKFAASVLSEHENLLFFVSREDRQPYLDYRSRGIWNHVPRTFRVYQCNNACFSLSRRVRKRAISRVLLSSLKNNDNDSYAIFPNLTGTRPSLSRTIKDLQHREYAIFRIYLHVTSRETSDFRTRTFRRRCFHGLDIAENCFPRETFPRTLSYTRTRDCFPLLYRSQDRCCTTLSVPSIANYRGVPERLEILMSLLYSDIYFEFEHPMVRQISTTRDFINALVCQRPFDR